MRITTVLLSAAALAAGAAGMSSVASAETLSPQAAERFVMGRTFSYSCYEGTVGSGRVLKDGSVAGTIQVRGKGNARYVTLPPGTVRATPEKVCAKLKGVAYQPCFELEKTAADSFRGNLAGFDQMWCEFKRGGSGRTRLVERSRNGSAGSTKTAQIDSVH
ncbi:hypothetical protein [Ancylobacter oerskovii]|uniref:Uncharacterized protein n=1 Tax=Ancylobacter oerskovii TaxID=459519 RepID=A0ABW4YVA0_9HYPH|nr:hypothetical protein [Ancylobacter oerskovii]MBS7544459.1 hypothetical protein [Ancylobacter oerskovii]